MFSFGMLMDRWKCSVCGYVYDEEKGEPATGTPSGTTFHDLPEDWRCPVCGAAKSATCPSCHLTPFVDTRHWYLSYKCIQAHEHQTLFVPIVVLLFRSSGALSFFHSHRVRRSRLIVRRFSDTVPLGRSGRCGQSGSAYASPVPLTPASRRFRNWYCYGPTLLAQEGRTPLLPGRGSSL